MKSLKYLMAAAATAAILPTTSFAEEADTNHSCEGDSAVFISAQMETGWDPVTNPDGLIGDIAYNMDGEVALDEDGEMSTVSSMAMAEFEVCSNGVRERWGIDRRMIAELLLLHNVLENPTPEMIAAEIEFGGQYITTEVEALESLQQSKGFLLPQNILQDAFNTLHQMPCSAAEYTHLVGTERAGFLRANYPRIPVNEEFLGAPFICPTMG